MNTSQRVRPARTRGLPLIGAMALLGTALLASHVVQDQTQSVIVQGTDLASVRSAVLAAGAAIAAIGTAVGLRKMDYERIPQVAVFDDVFGQDQSPYLGSGEFYADYGDFTVDVTVPEGWLVVGTGMLDNPDEVLHPEAVRTLASAAALDTVVKVLAAEPPGGPLPRW